MSIECAAKITEIIQRTPRVKSVRMVPEIRQDFLAGQFLSIALKSDKEHTRYLSISSSPTETGYLEVSKKLTDSAFSSAFEALKSGDSIRLRYPMGKFTFDGSCEKIAFLSGGIGITPIRSICRYIVDTGMKTDVVLLYANHSAGDVAFHDDFNTMSEAYKGLKVVNVLREPGDIKCNRTGMIDAGLIKEEIPDYSQRCFFVCGPPAMVSSMKNILADELRLPQGSIVTENFSGY